MDFTLIFSIALFSTILLSINSIYNKVIITEIDNPFHLAYLQLIIHFSFLIFFYLISWFFFGIDVNQNLTLGNIFIILLSSLFIFFGIITNYIGVFQGDVSVGSVIGSSRLVMSLMIAWLFFEENLGASAYFWLIFVVIGVISVNWEAGVSLKHIITGKSSGTLWFLSGAVLFTLGFALVRLLNNQVFVVTQLLFRLAFLLLAMVLSFNILNRKLANNKPLHTTVQSPKMMIKVFIYVLIIVIADFGITTVQGESLSVGETVAALRGLLVFLLVVVLSFLNTNVKQQLDEPLDRKTLIVRFTGTILATVGTIGFVFAGQ